MDAVPTSELAHERTSHTERILALDVARGFALLGIIIVHQSFAFPQGSTWNPFAASDPGAADYISWAVIMLFLEGCMRGVFEMLFGAGFLMILTKMEERDQGLAGMDIYARRTVGLLLFGFFHGYILLWPTDFLYRYGIAAFFLFLFRHLSPRWLFGFAAAFAFLTVFHFTLPEHFKAQDQAAAAFEAQSVLDAGGTLSAEQKEAIETFDNARGWYEGRSPENVAEMTEERLKGYGANFQRIAGDVLYGHTQLFYRLDFADTMVGMLIGMALFKMGLFSLQASRHAHLVMLAAGYGVGLSVNALEMALAWADGFRFAEINLNLITYDIGRMGTAIGHVAFVFLLCRSFPSAPVLRAMATVGQMTLTNYMLKSVLFAFTFYGFGLGLYGQFSLPQLLGVGVIFWAVIIVFSLVWLRRFRYGPAEWLWRSFSQWEWQPLRLATVKSAA